MMLNEDLVFGQDGYAHQYEAVRSDMYFMLDDGWDVDYGINPDKNGGCFGSLIMSEQRFPSVKGQNPAMKLKIINEKIRELGWKGIGIWVAAQRSAEDYNAPFGEGDLDYWKERVLWSREAGVEYRKVDWGTQADNTETSGGYTVTITKEFAKKAFSSRELSAPALVIRVVRG